MNTLCDGILEDNLYKVLRHDGSAIHGSGTWHLPRGKRPGKWMPEIEGELVPCENGYHLCYRDTLVEWLGPTIWVAEYRGEMLRQDDKTVVRQARLTSPVPTWTDRTARLFACDCAERVAHLANDKRCDEAIKVARRYADGEATKEELAIARDAALSAHAARDAALSAHAARDAAWDTWDAASAAYAARAAARAATSAAPWDAAWSASDSRAAARAATRDTWDAAARSAAWDAARVAERTWQTKRLWEYLDGKRT